MNGTAGLFFKLILTHTPYTRTITTKGVCMRIEDGFAAEKSRVAALGIYSGNGV